MDVLGFARRGVAPAMCTAAVSLWCCVAPTNQALAQSVSGGAAATSRVASCAKSDSAAAASIRTRLTEWVATFNAGDRANASEIWAPALVGWFPSAAVFGDSAAFVAAGIPFRRGSPGTVRYDITIEEIAATTAFAAVHDRWIETRRLPGATVDVKREIRGSELWRCQSDGQWRIARYVSAPEPWVIVR